MDQNLVNLDAYYYELVMQDKVNFTITVEAKEKSKEATLKSLKTKVKEVQEIFGKAKLVAQLTYQTVNEEHEAVGSKWKKTGSWLGSSHLQVIAYDFDLVNKIVDQLIESNQAQLGQVITSISEKTKQAKEEEFTSKAIEVFKAKAKNVAKAFDATDYKLVNVSVNSAADENGNNHRRGGMAIMASAAPMGGSMSGVVEDSSSYISPRESKIYVNIQGSVQLI